MGGCFVSTTPLTVILMHFPGLRRGGVNVFAFSSLMSSCILIQHVFKLYYSIQPDSGIFSGNLYPLPYQTKRKASAQKYVIFLFYLVPVLKKDKLIE